MERKDFIFQTGLLLAGASLTLPKLSASTPSKARQIVVTSKKGRFMGWPANNGLWRWNNGKELLFGFTDGPWENTEVSHKIGNPQLTKLARSVDGGQTWNIEAPDNFLVHDKTIGDSPGGLQFGSPDFAMRVASIGYHGVSDPIGHFFVSNDRGKNWEGPYRFNGLNQEEQIQSFIITARTNYIVTGKDSALIFMSAKNPDIPYSNRLDKTFVAETTDGGKSFKFKSWVVGFDDPYRAVMPSAVKTKEGKLFVALRRRSAKRQDLNCWIDLYTSSDNGLSWKFASKIGESGRNNGNPPALCLMADGGLACCYANRDNQQVVYHTSDNEGVDWSQEIVIRENPHSYDMGYPQLAENDRGQLIASYYLATKEIKHSYIEAAIINKEKSAK